MSISPITPVIMVGGAEASISYLKPQSISVFNKGLIIGFLLSITGDNCVLARYVFLSIYCSFAEVSFTKINIQANDNRAIVRHGAVRHTSRSFDCSRTCIHLLHASHKSTDVASE